MPQRMFSYAAIALLGLPVNLADSNAEASCSLGAASLSDLPQASIDSISFLQADSTASRATRGDHATSTLPRIPAALRSLDSVHFDDQPPQSVTSAEWSKNIDVNGRECFVCGEPSAERSDRDYEKRTDCGNQSLIEHPENNDKPLISFSRPAIGDQPETSAYCELNNMKACADSLYNKDFLFQAKSMYFPEHCGEPCAFDWWTCKYNGFLKPEIVALQHDFEGMKAESEHQCDTKYAKYGWNTTYTMNDYLTVYNRGHARGLPTKEEAEFLAAQGCAMGSAGCLLAFCTYTFCDYGDDVVRNYGECNGWDPVKGMPMPARD